MKSKKIFKSIVAIALVCVMLVMCMGAGYSGEVEKIIQIKRIETKLKSDNSEEFINSSPSTPADWIPLYDFSGARFAYFIPNLKRQEIIGYSVVSTINNRYKTLETIEGITAGEYTNEIISAYNSRDLKTDHMVYDFPNAFYLGDKTYFKKININGISDDYVDADEADNDLVAQLENQAANDKNNNKFTNQVYTTPLNVSLDHWEQDEFVPVLHTNGGMWYGGYQGWLENEGISEFWANRSCGLTAAANFLHYISEYVYGKSNLYTENGITLAEFSAFQKTLYDNGFNPEIWGYMNLNTMINKITSWGENRNVPLTAVENSQAWTNNNVKNYIINGLSIERPVLLETWNTPIAGLDWHWVTVTKIYDNSNGDTKIVASNWGWKEEYDFDTWCDSSSIYKAVIYFK